MVLHAKVIQSDNELSYASQNNYIVHAQQECNGRVQWKCSADEIEVVIDYCGVL